MNVQNNLLSPFPLVRANPIRGSIINPVAPKLTHKTQIKRISSLTKQTELFRKRPIGKSSIAPTYRNTTLLDINILPSREEITKDWESESEESKHEEHQTLEPVKMTSIEEFYEQRRSRMHPVNLMLTHRRTTDKTATSLKTNVTKKVTLTPVKFIFIF